MVAMAHYNKHSRLELFGITLQIRKKIQYVPEWPLISRKNIY